MRTMVVAILFCVGLPAQVAPRMASIEGVVTDAATGLPVASAEVRIEGPGNPLGVRSDAKGHYTVSGLSAGSYGIRALHEGYNGRGRRVRLSEGQELRNIDVKIEKESVLAGLVLDREGNPVIGVTVSVVSYGSLDGRPHVSSFHSGQTNDLGEFRISRLLRGRYYVEARPKRATIRKRLATAKERAPVVANLRTYYPNSPSLEGATPVILGAGEQCEGFDITLLRDKTVCVSSAVVDPASEAVSARVTVGISEVVPSVSQQLAAGEVASGDEVEVCGVPPGSYRLWASRWDNGSILRYASHIFTVANRPVEVPKVYLKSLEPVSGQVTVEGAKTGDPFPANLHIGLEPKDRTRFSGESTETRVEPSGSLVIPGAFPEEHWLQIAGLPPGHYVKAATMGDRDVWREPVLPGSGDLQITLDADGPSVSGQVTDRENRPIGQAWIILAASPLPAKIVPNQIRTAFSDQNGQFSLNGMPPGKYEVMAFVDLPNTEFSSLDLVRANLSKGTELTLSLRETKTVKITPLEAPPLN